MQVETQFLIKFGQTDLPVHEPFIRGQCFNDVLFRPVYVTGDLLNNVAAADNAGRASVLVHHDRQPALVLAELSQKLVKGGGFRNVEGRAGCTLDVVLGIHQELAHVQKTLDIIRRLTKDRQIRDFCGPGKRNGIVGGIIQIYADNVHARGHHITGPQIFQPHDAAEHGPLIGVQQTFLVTHLHHTGHFLPAKHMAPRVKNPRETPGNGLKQPLQGPAEADYHADDRGIEHRQPHRAPERKPFRADLSKDQKYNRHQRNGDDSGPGAAKATHDGIANR